MATYKSSHKGSQIDNAVSVANANLNRGTAETPIYFDSEGFGQVIQKDSVAIASSVKPLTSGGAYTGLNAVVDNSDIQWENFNGEFTKVGNVSIVDGVASGFSANDYLYIPFDTSLNNFKLEYYFSIGSATPPSARSIISGAIVWWMLVGGGTMELIYGDKTSGNTYMWSGYWAANTDYKITVSLLNDNCYFELKDISNNRVVKTYDLNVSGVTFNTQYLVFSKLENTSVDLKQLSISVDDKVVYTPYPQSTLPPSQNAAKQYVDTLASTKQDQLYGAYGIDVNGATVSVSDDVFRENEKDRLHADLKVDHFGDVNINNDSEMLTTMNEMKHSTFDLSKFTVVGSPVVTNDGIASGFSSSNYIVPNISFSSASNVEFLFKNVYIVMSNSSRGNDLFFGSSNGTYAKIGWNKTSKNLTLYNGSSWVSSSFYLNENTYYDFKLSWDGTTYSLYAKLSSTYNWATAASFNNSNNVLYSNLWIGRNNSQTGEYFGGHIDLKQFSITVDGVPVFSGNKTGIDTIKPDDYTTTATPPTITADGVASCNGVDYVSTPAISLSTARTFEVYSPYLTVPNDSNQRWILRSVNGTAGFFGVCFIGRKLRVDINTTNYTGTTIFTIGNKVRFKVIFDGTKYDIYSQLYGSDNWVIENSTSSSTLPNTNDIVAISSFGSTYSYIGDFDLNAFKIYVDGNLVYQPCLKIPYTLAKDGQKIVDSYYRDRVEDEYNQAGYTPYYTLQPLDKGNCTVVGSPTINSNWIASGFSSSNYLQVSSAQVLLKNSFAIEGKFTTGSDITNTQNINGASYSTNKALILGIISSKLEAWYPGSSASVNFGLTYAISQNTTYNYRLEYDGTNYNIYISPEGQALEKIATTQNAVFTDFLHLNIGVNRLADGSAFTGSIDLKAFKIYIDNKLVYTATPNYTLATVEENDIVDEYLSGATAYTQRANLQLEQQGTATNGATVSFPKAFSDTNYALTIPYSAKTTTGFTAAADGDWLAEGAASI